MDRFAWRTFRLKPATISHMKRCLTCEVAQLVDNFHRDARRLDGRAPYCKTCRSAYEAARRAENRDQINARTRERYAVADPRELRIRRRMATYGVTREIAEQIEDRTTCEWCSRTFIGVRGPDSKHTHHDHETGEYVATLCGRCNSIEGWVTQMSILASIPVEEYLDILHKGIVARNGRAS